MKLGPSHSLGEDMGRPGEALEDDGGGQIRDVQQRGGAFFKTEREGNCLDDEIQN